MTAPPARPVDEACVAALAALPGMGPAGLRDALAASSPADAWADVVAGRRVRPVRAGAEGAVRPVRAGANSRRAGAAWAALAARIDVEAAWEPHRRAGIRVTWPGHPAWPAAMVEDPDPPGALFWRGDLAALERDCVAIVGTRRATPEGRRTATRMAAELGAAGVCVVSGLALGIDGAAHRGALASGRPGATVGVAASGVDRPYPARHAELWEEVVAAGAVLGETPPGSPAQAWRFPARNRVIAGLVSVVVVVESHAGGGSLLTADAAIERGIEVRAVPGPVASPASAGTNQLLWDGPGPVRDATDVLDVLGRFRPRPVARPRRSRPGPPPAQPSLLSGPDPVEPVRPRRPGVPAPIAPPGTVGVLEAVGYRPTSFNAVVAAVGAPVGEVSARLEELAAAGLVGEERGWWQRRA